MNVSLDASVSGLDYVAHYMYYYICTTKLFLNLRIPVTPASFLFAVVSERRGERERERRELSGVERCSQVRSNAGLGLQKKDYFGKGEREREREREK